MKHEEEARDALYIIAYDDEYLSKEREIFKHFGKSFKAGELILREGDMSSDLFLLLSGSAEVVKSYGSGDQKRIARLEGGQIIGEMSYSDSMPRSATVVASADCDCIVLGREEFEVLFQLHPRWLTRLIETLSGRIQVAYTKLKTEFKVKA